MKLQLIAATALLAMSGVAFAAPAHMTNAMSGTKAWNGKITAMDPKTDTITVGSNKFKLNSADYSELRVGATVTTQATAANAKKSPIPATVTHITG